ncbi:multidrug resistance-associated protein 1-like protein, partial [Aphelenchoides avenae]
AICLSFYGYTVVDGHPMTPKAAFVSLVFFTCMQYAVYQLPKIVNDMIRAFVSGKRLVAFFEEEERQPSHLQRMEPGPEEDVVSMDNCSFTWGVATSDGAATQAVHLRNVSLRVRKGELIGVVGRVGSGKSSLLSAIVGEMTLESGTPIVRAESVGYIPQEAWIQNKTFKENVLFAKAFDATHYNKTLDACALRPDLELFAAGDQTEIGEKGINLSGGQKARVALARATYQRAQLYIIDDVLAAVDSHVANHIFDQVVGPNGLLRDSTRIFALNSLAFLRHCDRIVVMNDGQIETVGTLQELSRRTEGPFAELMKEFFRKKLHTQKSRKVSEPADIDEVEEMDAILRNLSSSPLKDSLARLSMEDDKELAAESTENPPDIVRQISRMSALSVGTRHSHELIEPHLATSAHHNAELGKFTDDEDVMAGVVSRRAYADYFRQFGFVYMVTFLAILFGGSSTCVALSKVWLAKWSSNVINPNATVSATESLAVYAGFSIAN